MRSLLEWIAELEAEECPTNSLQRKITRRLRQDDPDIVAYSTKADLLPACDYVRDALMVLWADLDFWMLLAGAPSPETICDFAAKMYFLRLPPFDHSVWREMVRDDDGRKLLFNLLRFRRGTFVGAGPSKDRANAITELRKRGIGELLLGYIAGDCFDQRYKTAWHHFSKNALIHLATAAHRVATDAKWFMRHPGVKAPLIRRKHRGRPLDVERAATLEELVKVINNQPAETDEHISKLVAAAHPEIESRRNMPTLRKLAGEAKRLASLRERLPVKHHVDGKFGRRPSRKNRRISK